MPQPPRPVHLEAGTWFFLPPIRACTRNPTLWRASFARFVGTTIFGCMGRGVGMRPKQSHETRDTNADRQIGPRYQGQSPAMRGGSAPLGLMSSHSNWAWAGLRGAYWRPTPTVALLSGPQVVQAPRVPPLHLPSGQG
ncbi:hypothetical protein COCCADRAFT_22508 [Bipolaris zeicola 26-R-13]|uniref:Uncharacterized protein n=1 Tax=Cochliobolus carbonum (strain 26-R-13) TaxID=930089 RepID=W6YK13_COCC2|nr:uncharacterized protein COCCADRAFT_22508 [Bipolaris zeicola 26-R-13]EUC37955.1 hypothetical protein COCCADRAFT_22508 [Bipolaris zeicola 26-R-13]